MHARERWSLLFSLVGLVVLGVLAGFTAARPLHQPVQLLMSGGDARDIAVTWWEDEWPRKQQRRPSCLISYGTSATARSIG